MASLAWNRWILYRSWNSEGASQFCLLRMECKIAVQNWWHFQSRDSIELIVSHVPRDRLCSNENEFSVAFGGWPPVPQAGYSYPWKYDISNPCPWQSEEFSLGLYKLLMLCGSWCRLGGVFGSRRRFDAFGVVKLARQHYLPKRSWQWWSINILATVEPPLEQSPRVHGLSPKFVNYIDNII